MLIKIGRTCYYNLRKCYLSNTYVLIGSESYMTIYCNTKGTLKIEKAHLNVNLT